MSEEPRVQARQLRLNPKDKSLDELGDNNESKEFIMEYDGWKDCRPTPYGEQAQVHFKDADTGERRVIFVKKDKPGYTNVFKKNLLDVFGMMKAGDYFTIKRVPTKSKNGFTLMVYHIRKIDVAETVGVKKAIEYAKEHNMTRTEVEELCDKTEATPEERRAILDGATWQN